MFFQIKPVLLFWQSSNSFAKTLFYPLIPHQRHPQAPVPSLPLRRWYDPKALRFVCLGKENILWGQVKQDVLECGPSLLLALCNNALSGANTHTQACMNVCTCVCTYTSEMSYPTTTNLVLRNAYLTGHPVVFTLKEEFVIKAACSEQACLTKTLRWENVKH